MTVLLVGIPSEPPLAMVADALAAQGTATVLLSQRRVADWRLAFQVAHGEARGWLDLDGSGWPLEKFTGVYLRPMDHRFLPELRDEPADGAARRHADEMHSILTQWCDLSDARIVNRPVAMGSNSSKTFQAHLVRGFGFDVPETLVTNDPDRVRAFAARFPAVIYKSVSGVRSIVTTLTDQDAARLETLRWCPTQFQERVDGVDVRVHVVGAEVFATRVTSDAVDYRYAVDQVGQPALLEAFDLAGDVAERCVQMAAGLGLAFAGIDLLFANDGRLICFEVNPCPGFSYYEANTGQPIAAAVAGYLSGGDAAPASGRSHCLGGARPR